MHGKLELPDEDNVIILNQPGGKLPPNWLTGLQEGTRFLAVKRHFPSMILDDYVLVSKSDLAVFLKERINFYENREFREYWVNAFTFAQEYILFEVLEEP